MKESRELFGGRFFEQPGRRLCEQVEKVFGEQRAGIVLNLIILLNIIVAFSILSSPMPAVFEGPWLPLGILFFIFECCVSWVLFMFSIFIYKGMKGIKREKIFIAAMADSKADFNKAESEARAIYDKAIADAKAVFDKAESEADSKAVFDKAESEAKAIYDQ
ncbi:MAG: hypothetical protein EXS07_12125, partial [Gemmataceae bacterium]|nr:hypothetical protein [Gemmataceae bacterium]